MREFIEILLKFIREDLLEKLRTWSLRRKIVLLFLIATTTLICLYRDTGRRLLMVAWNPTSIPLREADLKDLDGAITRTAKFLFTDYKDGLDTIFMPSQKYQAWNLAQIAVALEGLELSGNAFIIDRTGFLKFVQARLDTNCNCWHEIYGGEGYPKHVGATAWVVFALARLKQNATEKQIEFLLEQQHDDGFWTMFAWKDPRFASTYATAWSILALHEQLEEKLVDPEIETRIQSAIERGVAWINRVKQPGAGLWNLYPNYPKQLGQNKLSLSNSGLIIHAFHHLPQRDISRTDETLMDQLPSVLPKPNDWDELNDFINVSDSSLVKESLRCLILPWLLIAAVDTYPHIKLWQRVKALEFVENLIRELDDMDFEISQENWIAAEMLIALRQLKSNYLTLGKTVLR